MRDMIRREHKVMRREDSRLVKLIIRRRKNCGSCSLLRPLSLRYRPPSVGENNLQIPLISHQQRLEGHSQFVDEPLDRERKLGFHSGFGRET
jgi:hypothetical protein